MAAKSGTARKRRQGFGSIRLLPSGRYQVRYRGPDGLFHTGVVTFPTVADADAYLATVQADIVRQAWKAPIRSTESVESYVTRWIATHRGIKETTRSLYEGLAANNIFPLIGTARLSELTPETVRVWHQELADDVAKRVQSRRRLSKATNRTGETTVAQSYRLLRAALNGAQRDGLIQANPCTLEGADKAPTAERPTASRDQVQACADAMPERYRLVILLAAWTGIRLGELAALQRDDFDLDPVEPSVRIAQRLYRRPRGRLSGTEAAMDLDDPKSHASRRVVPLPVFLVPAIHQHLEQFVGPEGTALVFTSRNGTPMTSSTLTPIWHRARAKAGRPDLRLHDLRHTGQLMAALAGATDAELRRRMGHSTTAASAVYSHTTDEHGRAVADRLSAMATETNVVPLRPRNRRVG